MLTKAKQIVTDMHTALGDAKLTEIEMKAIFMEALEKNGVRLDEEMAELCVDLEYGIWCELGDMDDAELASEISVIIEPKPACE